MIRANHGASDQPARDRLWSHAHRQTDKDGKPRIPIQPNVKGPPDVERHGLSAEQQQNHRETLKQWYREERRRPIQSEEEWRFVVNKSKSQKEHPAKVAKPYNTRQIPLSQQYAMFEEKSSVSDEETPYYPTIPQFQSGFTSDDGMYKLMYSKSMRREVYRVDHTEGGRVEGVDRL